jgi:hypothetical protein
MPTILQSELYLSALAVEKSAFVGFEHLAQRNRSLVLLLSTCFCARGGLDLLLGEEEPGYHKLAQSEVRELDVAIAVQQHVVRLQITMDIVHRMYALHR